MSTFWTISIRTVATYLTLLALTRIMGKREISQMTYFDYIVGITLGSIATEMSTSATATWFQVLPALLIFCSFQIIAAFISIKSMSFRKIVKGVPTILVEKGKVLEQNLGKTRVSLDELMTLLREKNAFQLADVETAILETDGKLSVQKKSNKQPATPSDMNLFTPYTGLPRVVIEDGKIMEDSMKTMGLTRAWIMSKLGEQQVYDIGEVMLAQVDASGSLYVDVFKDFNKNTSKA